ncbi:MAG: squalene/phytoene synthase family protein [Verrucomicrobiota bacterium]|nr:squalene/phytoene synthase family protein [Verrucomicrobiota bacterium]
MTAREIDHLRGPILRSVSRSFYLSLRVLPRPLRDPLSLAYLLARATDTIADTVDLPVPLRAESLRDLAGAIQGTAGKDALRVRDAFAPRQSDEAERALIEAVPDAIAWLDLVEERDRTEVRTVLEKINAGQTLDLERFGSDTRTSIKALSTAAELEEYTYLVAGCVGEFWTRICFAHLPNFSDRPEGEMLALGAEYGKGLQLINILRDAGEDLRHGRCYFPASELQSLGVAPGKILRQPARVGPVLNRWRYQAGHGLEAGVKYACAIRNRRLRFATALPALIGARTLALLRDGEQAIFERRVKVPRREVRKMILASALASPRSLQASFENYRK